MSFVERLLRGLEDPRARAQLHDYMRTMGAAAGEAHAEALLAAEEDLAAALPPTPLQVTGKQILDLIPAWAEEASRVSRVGFPRQAELLNLAKTFRVQLAEAKANEEAQDQQGGAPP